VLPVLGLLFLVVPLVELYVIIQVGQELGALTTIAALIVISVLGAWLVKREGLGVWRRIQQQVGSGRAPGKELADAFLIMFAGALMLTPGFLTDLLGVLLLLPPTRAVIRTSLLHRLARRATVTRAGRRW
jgi:UPF0716 protein FxsA